ncbi:hypothetical protein H8D57_03660, partial [bacterium]|nr:hypothetical protein [bacterium]
MERFKMSGGSMQTHQNFLKEITLFLILFLIGSTYAVGPADVNNATEYHPLMVINETEESSITLGFELGELKHEEIKDEETNFDFFRTAQVLRPEEETNSLPTIVRYIQVPPQSGIDVQVRNLITRTIRGERPFLIKNKPDEMAFAEIDHRGFYPSKIAQIGKPMIMRGIRIAPIIINPVRFNEENNEIEIIESMELSIDFSSQNNKINLVDENIKPRSSRSVNRILNNLIINYSPDRDEPDNGGSVVYIIGNWDNIEEELQPLIEWRRRMGWTAEILRVASASTNAIKAAIQEAYDEWDDPPEHVVIVGDTDGSFPRGFYDTRDGSNWPYETDHKYIELEGDDVLPDATVGRFIIASANMCRDIVEKTVLYESDPYLGEDEERGWQTRGVLVASDNQSGTSSIDMCLWIREIAARTTYNSFSELYWNPGNPRPNARATIMNGINEGCSFFV